MTLFRKREYENEAYIHVKLYTPTPIATTIITLQDDLDWRGELSLVVLTMYDSWRNADAEALKLIRDFCGSQIADLIPDALTIPENAALRSAAQASQTIWEYAPQALGARAYKALVSHVARLPGGKVIA